jgi:hypothetical protein
VVTSRDGDDASVVDYNFLLRSWLLADAFVSGQGKQLHEWVDAVPSGYIS